MSLPEALQAYARSLAMKVVRRHFAWTVRTAANDNAGWVA